jgi:alpha-beta hydrolase superfamily lysophospholipase
VFPKFAENGIVVKGMDYRGHGKTLERGRNAKNKDAVNGYTPFADVFKDMLSLLNAPINGIQTADLPVFVVLYQLFTLVWSQSRWSTFLGIFL